MLVATGLLLLPARPSYAVIDDGAATVRPSPARSLTLPWRDLVPQDGRVWVLGDSLTVGTLVYGDPSYLEAAMSRRGRELSPRPSAKVGRTVAQGMAVLSATRGLPDDVVIALGTNDWWSSSSTAASWVARARRLVGPYRDIYWVGLAMTGSSYDVGERRINSGLLAGVHEDDAVADATGRPGRSYLLDWHAYVRDKGITNTGDGIHYSRSGYAARARFMAGALVGLSTYAAYVRT